MSSDKDITKKTKRAHKTLTIEQKVAILDELGSASYSVLCERYGIGRSTISDIKRKESELRQYERKLTEMGTSRLAKTMKLSTYEELERAVFMWFRQTREKGIPVSGPLLQAKALQLHEKLKESSQEEDFGNFVASSGWLWRFCKRHCIRQLALQGEKLSADKPAADQFVLRFQAFVKDSDYSTEQIFNCDESGLYHKLLPQKTLAGHFERSADGRKTQKDRVTISACSNASGSIKLPLVLIGKSKNPRCFKNVNRDHLPVSYYNQSNAWVNTGIFSDWFHHKFVPVVQETLREKGLDDKAVLLLDNCSAHPNEEDLISADGKVIAKFLPPNVTSLIQPMDQGVLVSIKRRYRKKMLQDLILQNDRGVSIIDFVCGINMMEISDKVSASWDEITPRTIRLSWRKILPIYPDEGSQEPAGITESGESFEEPSSNLTPLFSALGYEMTSTEIEEWLMVDNLDPGYTHLDDDEIVTEVLAHGRDEETAADEDQMQSSDHDASTNQSGISHGSAFQMLSDCLTWFREQTEATQYSLSVLRSLRDLAAKKRLSTLEQTRVTDYFEK
ncbi:jerky protein homolog-like [Corticium candelabrum]|uniref:jerky protein homolog-like n=1 Tax=Corticium candelabrum TaxID=121492 RepID=UPI002E27017D|nr:jerky protein homolog-like [Corticium candelabrum]